MVILYLLANVAYVVTLAAGRDPARPARPGRDGRHACAILGETGAKVMAAAILISTFGCVNGLVLAGARVYYAMARDGLFFRSVGTTNRQHVPPAALVAQGLWAALLVLPVTVTDQPDDRRVTYGNLYNELLEYIIPVDVTFYTLMVGAVIALRLKAPSCSRPYRTIGYPVPSLDLHRALAVLLVVDFIYLKPWTSGKGFLIVLAGIPVYLVWTWLAGSGTRQARRMPSELGANVNRLP